MCINNISADMGTILTQINTNDMCFEVKTEDMNRTFIQIVDKSWVVA